MSRRVSKGFRQLRDWLDRAGDTVNRGEDAYAADGLLKVADDSLRMKPWET